MTDAWRRAGFDAQPYVLPPAQILNHELKTTFTGLMTTRGGVDEASLRYLSTSGIPAPENRWSAGINYGGWSDGEYDRLLDTFNRSLDRDERSQLVAQMMKRAGEQVPWIFLYYGLTPVAYDAALQGPQVPTPSRPSTWNVHEWDWR
jgi:peptide/nickel transport system substrate-binding protein